MSAIAWNAVRDGNGITVRHQWNAQQGQQGQQDPSRQQNLNPQDQRDQQKLQSQQSPNQMGGKQNQ